MEVLYYSLEFLVGFLLVFLYYRLIILKKEEKLNKKKLPPELNLFIKMNNIDMRKITYNKLLKVLSVVNALVVAFVLLSTEIANKIIFKLLIAIPVGVLLILGCYKLLGVIYKKKGMTKSVKNK